MRTISKSKLKANLSKIFQEIEASGEEMIVTHYDKPVLRIIPINNGDSVPAIFGELQGKVTYYADPDEPTTAEWNDV